MDKITLAVLSLLAAACVGASWLAYTGSVSSGRLAQRNNEVLDRVERTLRELPTPVAGMVPSGPTTAPTELPDVLPGLETKALSDLDHRLSLLPPTPTARQVSACLVDVDAWIFDPRDEAAAGRRKGELVERLRTLVRTEVHALQARALQASTGGEASTYHAEAGQTLALYPMSEDSKVLDEARGLAARQADVAGRIEALRRQRYNSWAVSQIGQAIDGYNRNSSYFSPNAENLKLMDSLVRNLGEVDPALLEPSVLELYNYVVQLTKDSISEAQKVELAKRLTAPSLRRRTVGDF